jgi:hypothetical protein
MKLIILKLLLVLPSLLFVDTVIMIVFGFTSSIFGANVIFFSTVYSYFGIILIGLTFLLMIAILFNKKGSRVIKSKNYPIIFSKLETLP